VVSLTFVIGTKGRHQELQVLLSSLVVQTNKDFQVLLADEGEGEESEATEMLVYVFNRLNIRRSHYPWTGDWHYTAKNRAADEVTTSKVCFPQDDWYYVPTFVEKMLSVKDRLVACDFLLWNSHLNIHYPVVVAPVIGQCSIGNWVIDTNLFNELKFIDIDYLADGRFVERANEKAPMRRIPETLAVSN
jgi:hypothetical protein